MPKTSTVLIAATLALASATGSADAALVISKSASNNVTCVQAVCSATAADAVLNIKDLKKLLQKADLKVVSGSAAQDIEIDVKFKWTKPSRLTLDSYHSIVFNQAITSEGSGGATLTTNDGGTGGQLIFSGNSHLTFWDLSSSLILDGVTYTLVGDVKSLAQSIALNPSGSFALAKMYDASVDGTYANSPIVSFDGNFTGLGHALANLTIVYSQKVHADFGLFQTLGPDSFVRNLRLQNAKYSLKVKNYSGNVGLLAANGSGRVSDIGVIGGGIGLSVSGPHRDALYACVGGVVSRNAGQISRAQINGASFYTVGSTGGVACSNTGTISQAQVNATVGGGLGSWAGGIAAGNGGAISLSRFSGSVYVVGGRGLVGSNGDEGAGGITADNQGLIELSFSTAPVDAGASSAGEDHEGWSYGGGVTAINEGAVANSYSLGSISTWDPFGIGVYVGGFQGASSYYQGPKGSVTSGYSTNSVECDDCDKGLGGFAGDSGGTFTSGYWDEDTSQLNFACGYGNTCTGITGLTDAQLKSGLPAGFDPAVWGESPSINNGYPYLIENPPPPQ